MPTLFIQLFGTRFGLPVRSINSSYLRMKAYRTSSLAKIDIYTTGIFCNGFYGY